MNKERHHREDDGKGRDLGRGHYREPECGGASFKRPRQKKGSAGEEAGDPPHPANAGPICPTRPPDHRASRPLPPARAVMGARAEQGWWSGRAMRLVSDSAAESARSVIMGQRQQRGDRGYGRAGVRDHHPEITQPGKGAAEAFGFHPQSPGNQSRVIGQPHGRALRPFRGTTPAGIPLPAARRSAIGSPRLGPRVITPTTASAPFGAMRHSFTQPSVTIWIECALSP